MHTLAIAPYSASRETAAVIAVTAVLLLGGGIAVSLHQQPDHSQRLYDWQISAFYELNETDQAIYNALAAAVDELWYLHADILAFNIGQEVENPWPTVQELGEYYVMPPFSQDLFWEQQGRVQWQRIASFSVVGSNVYFGSGGTVPGQSAYLLSLSHVHKGASYTNGATIWLHPDAAVEAPPNVVRDTLIKNGWREVVPYTGGVEMRRVRGS